jgi:hypothetical protein
VETFARRQALHLAARVLEQRLNADTSDYVGPELPCPCGGVARYHGRHGKTFESVLGPLHLKRAYYDCGRCHHGFCPRDRALKLESFSLTPGVPEKGLVPRLAEVIPAPKKPQKLPVVLSPEEVLQFLDCVRMRKHRAILTTCYAAGLRISEAIALTPPAIDSKRMVIGSSKVKGGKIAYGPWPTMQSIFSSAARR